MSKNQSCRKIFSNIIFFILSTILRNSFQIHLFKTSSTVASTLYQLALHPDEQDRAYNEVCNILPSKDMQLDGKHLDKLKYLKACIKETLRFVFLKSLIFYFYSISLFLRIINFQKFAQVYFISRLNNNYPYPYLFITNNLKLLFKIKFPFISSYINIIVVFIRMYPVVIGNGRCMTKDTIIKGYRVPKGVRKNIYS